MRKILIVLTIILAFLIALFLWQQLTRELAPEDDSAAVTYYVSPNGNDNNPGTSNQPWKTIKHADEAVPSGSTVILRDGIYSGNGQAYIGLDKKNVTWRAENKHKAIIDGGFGPGLINGSWNNIVNAYNTACNVTDGRQKWTSLWAVDVEGITIDGVFLRNSCGRGILFEENVNNVTFMNSKIDWTMVSGFYVVGKTKNLQVIGNEITRISFNDEYAQRVAGYCQPATTPPSQQIKKYCVNISLHMSGEDTVVRDNIIAFGRGEIAMTGARNLLFENNTVVSNKNNFYNGWADGVTVRNNFFWNPDAQTNPGTHWEKSNNNDNNWHLSSRNEDDDRWTSYASGLNDVKYYNNVIINNSVQFNGYHNNYGSDTTNVYFGHNTLVTGPETDDFFKLTFNAKDGANKDAKLTALIENNVFDVSKDPNARFIINKSSNDTITFRNNLLPNSAPSAAKGSGDVYTNNSGLVNPSYEVDYMMPAIGATTVDMNALRNAVNIQYYMLKNNSPAIDKGSKAGAVGSIQIPQQARQIDYNNGGRDSNPDIGAFESGSVIVDFTPTPSVNITTSPTVVPTTGPSSTPRLTNTPRPTSTVRPTVPRVTATIVYNTNVCGKADVDGDGKFSIIDFQRFGEAYGSGRKLCDDTTVDYGECGGRDWNRDGKLNIIDFGGSSGFAKRYSPKNCNL